MNEDSVELICSISELASLFENYTNLDQFLQTVANIIARHMNSSVCSIYLYDDAASRLVLQATFGLEKFAIGKVTLQPGEGLTGLAFARGEPVLVSNANRDSRTKFFPGILEETYEAFLAVPIIRGEQRIGVIVIQDADEDLFDKNDLRILKAIAAQLAATIENAKLLMSLDHQINGPSKVKNFSSLSFLKGELAAPGIALGRGLVYCSCNPETLFTAQELTRPLGLDDFERALGETESQLTNLQQEMAARLTDMASLIFSAHLLMLKDSSFSGMMRQKIKNGVAPRDAILMVVDKYVKFFSQNTNQRFKEKIHDIKDLGQRLLYNLFEHPQASHNYRGKILIADELLPSDILKIAAQQAEGLIMINSAVTAHISTLVKSLELPTVITDRMELLSLGTGSFLILDADQANIYINPKEEVIAEYKQQKKNILKMLSKPPLVKAHTFTRDKQQIHLLANINLYRDIKLAEYYKAEGVGLYRSEFPFIVRNDFPSEEEQVLIYKRIIEALPGREVVIRTLDIGGDKMLSFYPHITESNPFLGMRAIRFSLRNKDIFATQLRAILRAAGEGSLIKIMFPLVSAVDDFMKARTFVQECAEALAVEQIPACRSPLLGVMVELPSAVAVIEELCDEADFLSIGSNDLVQYLLAVDRTNRHLSDLYQPHHPAVLRSLDRIVKAARAYNKPLSLCGDIASDPVLLPFLVGLGIRTFSINPRELPKVQKVLQKLDTTQAEALAVRLLALGRISAIEEALHIQSS